MRYETQQSQNTHVYSGLQYKICRDTYHMLYILDTEDVFVRHHTAKQSDNTKKNNKWATWLDKHWNDNTNKEEAEEQAKRLFQ